MCWSPFLVGWLVISDHLTKAWKKNKIKSADHPCLLASSLNTPLHSTLSCEAGQNQLSLLQKKGNGPLRFHLLPSSSLTLSYLSLPPTSSLSHSSTLLIHCPPGWGLPGEAAFHNVQAFPLHLEVSQQAAYTLLLKKKKEKKQKNQRGTEKRHHIPQPSVSPGRLRGIFSHTAQNALVRAERPHTLYHYHANREWSEQSCRKKERRGSYQCFHLMWGSHLNIWKICRKRPKVDIPGWNNVTVGSGESSPLMERDLCWKDSPSSRMCYSKDCKTLSKSELLSPQWFVHRKYKPRKSESNTAWFRFPKTTYTFNSNFSLLQCSL